ncbi:MAG: hypothetical protein JJU09_05230 [Rhodobacteraceae bacterium]|nr:hypothetical protein [Paracoccaceae bacterium]TVR48345.1 MAG: curlin [Paracoccaceae bacterium]
MSRFSHTHSRRILSAALVSVALALSVVQAQASSLSLKLRPGSSQEARALDAAVTLYALHRDLRSGADIRQTGRNNTAVLRQSGGRNRGIIRQRGDNHTASLSQIGGNNTQVIVQYGNGAHADIGQRGGQSGILLQFAR